MRVLDLFCGAGGAAMGLHRVWPEAKIVGIDIKPQPRYPFTFVQGDVMDHLDSASAHLCSFDFIWASPPCQRYSCVTPLKNRSDHPDLLAMVRSALIASEQPYVIENVPQAPMSGFILCGSMFGLQTRRHRKFETSWSMSSPKSCDHSLPVLLVTTAGANSRKIGNYKSVANAKEAYEIDWMIGKDLAQSIPPAYSQYIAARFDSGGAERIERERKV